MKLSLSHLFQLSLIILGALCGTSEISVAQVTSDGTVDTQVDNNGSVSEITGGETKGDNLFHSFQDFSVREGNEAFFNNASDISNIFSRVTGGNVSNINGLISANGSASLFLINPAGIIFGESASLNIGGSFYGSTADSILFKDGEFSATDLDNPPLLTINAPVGLGFRDNPGEIVNNSVANDSRGLSVSAGNNIALLGGNVSFNNGNIVAPDATVNLGGIGAAGVIKINDNGSLSFPTDVAIADVTINNSSIVDVAGTGTGNININAGNFELTAGELGSSLISAGVTTDSNNREAENITINATDNIAVDDSAITNIVNFDGVGDAGDISITTGSLSLTNGGRISASNFGQGNAGSIDIVATDIISVNGESSDGLISVIGNSVNPNGEGSAGDVSITTGSLSLTNGGQVGAGTFGQGNAGSVEIIANDTISVDGESSDGLISVISNSVLPYAVGNAGDVSITTGSLSLTNGGRIDASTFGLGNAGSIEIIANDTISVDGESSDAIASGINSSVGEDAVGDAGGISITTNSLSLTNGGQVDASTLGTGNAGSVEITATDTISVDGEDSEGFPSSIGSSVSVFAFGEDAEGDAGGISITTGSLSLTNGGQVSASTFGEGNAGSVEIIASDTISVDGEDSDGFASGISSSVFAFGEDAEGDAGGISITTGSLSLTNGGQVDASTFGLGNAGSVEIMASDAISVDGEDSEGFPSGIFSSVEPEAVGDAGSVSITTNSLSIANGGVVSVSADGEGDAGELTVKGNSLSLDNDSGITASTIFGQGGIINLQIAENITLKNNSAISAQAFEDADGGNLNIDTKLIIAFSDTGTGNDLVAGADGGIGGNININAEQILGLEPGDAINSENVFFENNTNEIDASSNVSGFETNSIQGTAESTENVIVPEQTITQVCHANRELAAKNGLIIKGKGGVPPAPDLPMDSANVYVDGEDTNLESVSSKPIVINKTKIVPARGIKVNQDGRITLTAYPTNNRGDRLIANSTSCGG